MKIVGFKAVDFKAKDGKQITGYKVFCVYEDKSVSGSATDAFFLSSRILGDAGIVPKVGICIDVLYNKYGKISAVKLV